MKMMQHLYWCAVTLILLSVVSTAIAGEIKIAVASNFNDAFQVIAERFETHSNHKVIQISGSTGKHYAQIKHGAPFDAYFAADARRPKLLEQEGLALPGSRFTYAVGKLVLWSPQEDLVDTSASVLTQNNFQHLSIANPKLAPYGRAAQQVLTKLGLWNNLQRRMVRGENIGQAFQFVRSGNVKLGFVALSQIKNPGTALEGSYWQVPESFYAPIEQQAVLLKDNKAARAFLDFVRQDEAQGIIRSYGYATP